MLPSKRRFVSLGDCSDAALVRRLQKLNKYYRTGLSVRTKTVSLDTPAYADRKLWRIVNTKINELHQSDPQQLQEALDCYENWAIQQSQRVEWVHKDKQHPRLLGEPTSHFKVLDDLLGQIEQNHPPRKLAKRMISSDSSGRPFLEDVDDPTIFYPSFSQEHTAIIDPSRSSSSQVQASKSAPSFSSKFPTSSRPSKGNGREPPQFADTSQVCKSEDIQHSTSIAAGDSSCSRYAKAPERPVKLQSVSSASATTSFATSNPGRSFATSTGSSFKSPYQTQNTSFGLHEDVEYQQPVKSAADSLLRATQVLENNVTVPSPDIDRQDRKSLMSGISQMSTTQEYQMIQLDVERDDLMCIEASESITGRTPAAQRLQNRHLSDSQLTVSSRVADDLCQLGLDQSASQATATGTKKGRTNSSLFVGGISPFESASFNSARYSLRVAYEIARFALAAGLHPDELSKRLLEDEHGCITNLLADERDNYEDVWKVLSKASGRTEVERCSQQAWRMAKTMTTTAKDGGSVVMSGRLKPGKTNGGAISMTLYLSPLKLEKTSNRVNRKYGAGRLFVLDVPEVALILREKLVDWLFTSDHQYLGRSWSAFYAKPIKDAGADEEKSDRVYLFATHGDGLDRMSLYSFLNSILCFRKNKLQQATKFFARIGLSLTDTFPGFSFTPDKVIFTSDTRSCCPGRRKLQSKSVTDHNHERPKGVVMNDGAARISYSAAAKIARQLGLSRVPTAFQGRIGGSKGMWLVERDIIDGDESSIHGDWIEITESQVKFDCSNSSKRYDLNYIFEVHSYSHALKPYSMSDSLIPILEDRGVPLSVFTQLLDEDLESEVTKILEAMEQGGPVLYKWIYENTTVAATRAATGQVKWSGGFPSTLPEQIIAMLSSGLNPLEDYPLFKACRQDINRHCRQLEKKTRIQIACSAHAYILPDHLGVLEEGEIHIGFSDDFQDPNTELPIEFLDGIDVIVARYPSYLPSDVQKVKAVRKRELEKYKDVIFFSSKCKEGNKGLAEMLSGGDYDGDKAFICWEPRIVKPFQNAKLLSAPEPSAFGIRLDSQPTSELIDEETRDVTNFVLKGGRFNMMKNILGNCANYYNKLNYGSRSINTFPEIGVLLGFLVDAPKQGYEYSQDDFKAYLKSKDLPHPSSLQSPYYKWQGSEDARIARPAPTEHILDSLILHAQETLRLRIQTRFEQLEIDKKIKPYDPLYERIFINEKDRALEDRWLTTNGKPQGPEMPEGWKVLVDLEEDLEALVAWFMRKKIGAEEKEKLHKKKKGPVKSEKSQEMCSALLSKTRSKFLNIRPRTLNTDILRRWSDDCTDQSSQLSTAGAWTRLKASALYSKSRQQEAWHTSVAWLIAGKELCEAKAMSLNCMTVMMIPAMQYAMRPNARMIEQNCKQAPAPTMTEEEGEQLAGLGEDPDLSMADVMSTAPTMDELFDG